MVATSRGLAAPHRLAVLTSRPTRLLRPVGYLAGLKRGGLPSLATILSALLVGCGRDGAPSAISTSGAPIGHVHGLGVDPADRSLLIATHDGLFRAAEGEAKARRIGRSTQDTMGFTVVGPRRYLGSGHPGLQEDGPPLLGLIESRDGGEDWTPVALSGQVDFHVLRAAGRRVYGVDANSGRLLVSRDRGRSWAAGSLPAPVVDLAVDPEDDRHLFASTEEGLQESANGGATWRERGPGTGLLAWPAPSALRLVERDGSVHTSRDGRSWGRTGSLGAAPVALAADGERLLAALESGAVRVSEDEGRTWRPRADL